LKMNIFLDQLEISQVLIDQLIVRTIKNSKPWYQIYTEQWTKRIKTEKKNF
jgi:hypothetical protein